MTFSKFNISAHLPDAGGRAVYNTLTGGLVVLDEPVVKNLETGKREGLNDQEVESLEEMGVLVPDGVDEDRLFDLFYNQIRFSGRELSVTLLTTMNCNFACPYCYEGELTAGKKQMTDETAGHVIAWMKARAKESRVAEMDIQYHGGEPLLNISVIEKVGHEMTAFCKEEGIRLTTHMVSNGYLLDRKTAERVRAAGVKSVRITLDGPADVHDGSRFLKGGGKTFEKIMKNLSEIKEILGVSIGINYTKETATRIPEFLDELTERGLGPDAIRRVGCAPVMPGEGSTAFDSGCIPSDELFEDYLPMHEEVVKRGYWRHEDPEICPCPVVMAGNFTINYDGDVCKCPALADRPEYSVGHVSKDLVYNAEMYRSLGQHTFENEECRNCAVLPLCLGGCRYLALIRTGTFHEIDCRKKNIEAITKAAVLRMVKESDA